MIKQMENRFTITNQENTLSVSIQFEDNVNPDDKKKLHQMILTALELWEGKDKFIEKLDEVLKEKKCLHDGLIHSGHHADQPSFCAECGEEL